MELKEMYYVPHSDTGADEIDIIKQHNNLIKQGQHEEAVALLDDNNIEKGVRASLLNSIQNKIRKLQLYILNEFVALPWEYYSDTEPTTAEMGERIIWLKPWE